MYKGCILSKFYIKPQRFCRFSKFHTVVSYRNSTSNHNYVSPTISFAIVVSYRNSTSNHNHVKALLSGTSVVSYRNSTSNHNLLLVIVFCSSVVSYRNSTSNHNVWLAKATHKRLYLIEILHQTTTRCNDYRQRRALYLIEILHQTTTPSVSPCFFDCCILSKFYIKPQQTATVRTVEYVVSYRNSTSNHNGFPFTVTYLSLYLIEILHQTTTRLFHCCRFGRCILSKFYIKPQLRTLFL